VTPATGDPATTAAATGTHRERVAITGIAAGGAGVGRLADGRAVFVARTAPGDQADVVVVSEHGRWTRGRLLNVAIPGPDRCEAPCVHYNRCGGCALQHVSAPGQIRAKASMVAETLRRIGGIDTPVPDVVPSPRAFGYRNRVSFTLRRTSHGVVAGFHRIDRPDRVLDIDADCLLPEPVIPPVWAALRKGWGPGAALLPAGPALRLTLRAGSDGAVLLLIEGGAGRGEPEALLTRTAGLASIWHAHRLGGEARLLAGTAALRDRWGALDVGLAGAAFVQVNRGAAALLDAWVDELAGEVRGQRVIDAYCGIGVRACAFAGRGAVVTGIDLDASAIALARRAAQAGAAFEVGPVEERLADLLPADLVVLNPPRAGLHAGVCRTLREHPPERVIYVSCDPATLARDLARLQPVFGLRSLRCFDLFPQTAHVETVAGLACVTS